MRQFPLHRVGATAYIHTYTYITVTDIDIDRQIRPVASAE